jgi:hypothetical protein
MAKTPQKRKAAGEAPAVAVPATTKPVESGGNRRLKVHAYRSFRLQKKVKRQTGTPLPSGFALLKTALKIIRQNWKVFLGISALYALLTAGLVTGFSAVNLSDAKQSFGEVVSGQINQAATGLSLFVYMLGSAGATGGNPAASVYQIVLGVVVSLAIIWTLRQVYAGKTVRVRDGFYQGMYPFVQFVLVLLVVGLQLLPLLAGAAVYQLVVANGIAATPVEFLLWLALFFLLALLSIYMVCASLFALYIVSLPGVTPFAALRSAKQLVLHRRWAVVRKVLFLPLALIVIMAVITIPFIMLVTPVAPWLFFILSTMVLVVVHGYLYALYKAML